MGSVIMEIGFRPFCPSLHGPGNQPLDGQLCFGN